MDGPLPGRMTCRRKRSTAWAPLPLLLAPLFSTVARSQALFTSTAFVRPLVPVSPSMFRILLRRQHDVTTHIFPSLHHQRHRLLPPASVVRLATAQSTTSTTSTRRKSTTSSKAGSKAKTSAGASKKKVNGGKSRSAEGTGDEPGLSSGTNLIIVESATKANTIKRFLTGGKGGDKWEVDFCMGHVRELPRTLADMPPTAKKEKSKVLGVKIDQDYEPVWIVLPGRESVVSRLKEKAKTCSALYLATDEDREGEAISWHLLDLLQPRVPVHRVIFHEITPTAVGAGLASPRPLDIALVEAQHARRVLDRVAGYTMSPLLWKKIARGLSAGRVQSAGLKLLVDRERERMTFQSAAYAGLRATLVVGGEGGKEGGIDARLQTLDGQRLATSNDFDPKTGRLWEAKAGSVRWLDDAGMARVAAALADPGTVWRVKDVETRVVTRRRPAPFTTSTLQQEANSRLGLTSSQTMKLAQELYEEGHISYMRTDSPNMGPEALAVARVQAREQFGDTDTEPVVASEKAGKGKKNLASATAQEAHEAVRPSILVESNRFRTPKEMGSGWIADKKKLDLYTLIYERTLASVMKDAKMERKTVAVEARSPRGGERGTNHLAELVVTGQTILTRGFLRALREEEQAPTASLSPTGPGSDPDGPPPSLSPSFLDRLTPGQALSCLGTKVLLHATSPPYRYTQGSFVRTVEELGIGRPSTYATIIEVLKTRRYFAMKGTAMVPTLVGFVVAQLLEGHFPAFVDAGFTSQMEGQLDLIAKGNADRVSYLDEYYRGLTSAIETVEGAIDRKSAKRVLLPSLGENATCGVFVGPYGPYVRDLLPGEPSDALLLRDPGAAKAFYQDVWADDDAGFMKSTSEVRRAPVPAEFTNDPASITAEAVESLLEMSGQGKGITLGRDARTGSEILLRATKYGRSLEVTVNETLHRVQVPQSINASSCPPAMAARLLHDFPRSLGLHPTLKEEMLVNLGHYPNLRVGNRSFGLLSQGVAELLSMTADDAIQIIAAGKPTFYLGDYKGASMWFVPKGRYSYPHIRWNQIKLYLKEDMLGPGGSPPSYEAATALVDSKGGGSGPGGGGRGGGSEGGRARGSKVVKKEKITRSPSAFLLFTKEKRPEMEKGLTFGEQQKVLSAAWKALPEDSQERLIYLEKAEKLRETSSPSSGKKRATSASLVPRNAYQLFCHEARPSLSKGISVVEQAKTLSAKWKEVDEEARRELGRRLEAMREEERERQVKEAVV